MDSVLLSQIMVVILVVTENDCDFFCYRDGLRYSLLQRMTMILFVTEDGCVTENECDIVCYRVWLRYSLLQTMAVILCVTENGCDIVCYREGL